MGRSNYGIRVRRELKIAPPRPKLTLVGLSGRQAGAAEREDQGPQRLCQVGCVFPGRDQDCVRIERQDDQSLGFWCAVSPQIAPPRPKLTLAGSSGRHDGAVEREEGRAQQRRVVRGFTPGWDQDCVWIGRQDNQSLGFGCTFALKSPLLGQN